MMIERIIVAKTCEAVNKLYGQVIQPESIQIQKTNKEFEGDLTVVVFPFTKISKKSPEQTAQKIGNYLQTELAEIKSFNVIKGFLNLVVDETYWLKFFNTADKHNYGFINGEKQSKPVIIEYSSPNTNKPLHLGHIRNNLLGYSLAKIAEANGRKVKKVNLVNDRGIHICKSMLAYQKWGNGETPESSSTKGDHLVGKYYVLFEKHYKEEIEELTSKGMSAEEAPKKASLIIEAQEMLKKWEKNDKDVRALWSKMNAWVYDGFKKTYKALGVDFDKTYYESETYLLGKALVEKGLTSNTFTKRDDGSVWVNLTDEGLDEKLLIRSDGTSVYMTQDLGTAHQRYDEYKPEKMIYVVGNEQDYHFKVLKLVLKKLDYDWADDMYHFSYGMVELPEGKMKSREGTVVDADDLIDEMETSAYKTITELGKSDGFTEKELRELSHVIGLGALKYFILKVDPKKSMLFNPQESIDFNGNTGPFIQYTHARIQSILRKAAQVENNATVLNDITLHPKEKELIKLLHEYPTVIKQAGEEYSPALIANYVYELAKEYNQFYQEIPILKEEDKNISAFRIELSAFVGKVIKSSMSLLGIDVPERM